VISLLRACGLVRRDEPSELARRAQADLADPFALDQEELDRFQTMLRAKSKPEIVLLGRLPRERDPNVWIGLPIERFIALHGSCVGATGTGKSYWVLGLLLQLLRGGRHAVVVVDLKGEMAALLLDLIIPALVADGHTDLVSMLRVIRPFDREYAPLLRLTEPEAGVSKEVQALSLLTSIEESLCEPFGTRMSRITLLGIMLAIERQEPLDVVRRWLHDRSAFARAAHASSDGLIREYASGSFGKEQSSSIEAAAARIDEFLFDPATRDALAAPSCLSFAELLENGTTIVDLGDPPAGAERLSRFWGAVILGRLTRAVLARPVTKQSGRVWFVVDEVQEALGPKQAAAFARLLSLARFKKVGLLLVNQEPAQVANVDPLLASALKTNIGYRVAFRSNLEDAKAIAHALPRDGRRDSTRGRDRLVEELTRLRDRHYLFWLRAGAFHAQILRSPRLDLDRMESLAASLGEETRQAIRRGTTSIPRTEIRHGAPREPDGEDVDQLAAGDGTDEVDSGFPRLG
jgi:hypothetical protein